jgi:hypothetical protein
MDEAYQVEHGGELRRVPASAPAYEFLPPSRHRCIYCGRSVQRINGAKGPRFRHNTANPICDRQRRKS